MTKAEIKRHACKLAAEFIRDEWDRGEWDEKDGADAARFEKAFLELREELERRAERSPR